MRKISYKVKGLIYHDVIHSGIGDEFIHFQDGIRYRLVDVEVVSNDLYLLPQPSEVELRLQAEVEAKRKVDKEAADKAKASQAPAACSCKGELEAMQKQIAALEKEVKALRGGQSQASPPPPAPPQPQPTGQAASSPTSRKININTETDVANIARLPVISSEKAKLVIPERESSRGKFKNEEDVVKRLGLRTPYDFKGRIEF